MPEGRVYELRTYYATPKKMPALLKRFENHTLGFFRKYGMTVEGFWLAADSSESEQKLVYLMSYPSKEDAKKSWDCFRADPDWIAARNASEQPEGQMLTTRIESLFLDPVSFSPMK